MARVFTITPGLENMGALKTGGQGSVYKARRIGEIITAVKILPTPIYSESADDKNFIAFQNEVSKLKKVNEEPNPNVVKILHSGITESGNLPFIEMEFIEGPDLEDLLKPPHEPVFTIKEVLKVAEQLSNALAHCHKLDIKHGDIKSNNVKFSNKTANYVLLDFGLAIMSDEERRSSLRQAGAIEFMAPEQNTGQMLFETDVYSFGVVLYELLAGTVPFKLKDRSESARNEVRLAHMVTPAPDLLPLRKQVLPNNWSEQKRLQEMNVPKWLIKMIYKCLEKKTTNRFKNGIELYAHITENFINSGNSGVIPQGPLVKEKEWNELLNYNRNLQEQVGTYQKEALSKSREIEVLKMQLNDANNKLQHFESQRIPTERKSEKGVSRASFTLLLFLTIALAAFAVFSVVKSSPSANQSVQKLDKRWGNETGAKTDSEESTNVGEIKNQKKVVKQAENKSKEQSKTVTANKGESQETGVEKTEEGLESIKPVDNIPETEKQTEQKQTDEKPVDKSDPQEQRRREEIPPVEKESNQVVKRYKVVSKAYFYANPEETSREDMFIGPWENAIVDAISERYGYVFVEIKNPQGQVFRGWLRKKDLKLHSIQ